MSGLSKNDRAAKRRRRQSGQLLPIAAIAMLVLCAIAGLAIDIGRDYLVKRNAQNAADFAALAAAKQLALQSQIIGPPAPGSNPVKVAHDFASNNGFDTMYSSGCDQTGPGSFSATWFDVGGVSCTATAGFTNKVQVRTPAASIPGSPVPPICTSDQYACLQVVITTKVNELFSTVLGINSAYLTVAGTAHATLPGVIYSSPPPNAVVLYEPKPSCDATQQQCFNESAPAARTALSCSGGSNNCPTFWTKVPTHIYGYDGAFLSPAADLVALQSAGDMVIQGRTTICDPYNGATCAVNAVVGAAGFAVQASSNVYCQKYGTGASFSIPCSTTGQSSLQELDANQAVYVAPSYWRPTVSTSGLTDCGSLILNGGAITGPCAKPSEPYVIEPGIYQYIVINHGTYEFDPGLFDITGVAPVNTNTGAGYIANGIDHSKEVGADFDLCTGGQPNSCPSLSAGVWIGHGGGSYGAYVAPSTGSCSGSTGGSFSSGGGGDATIVSGSGVAFRLEGTSGGFVSTNEVQGLQLSSPGIGGLAAVGGAPLLIDEENSSFIHLDAHAANTNALQGLVFQTPSATGGGVEMNPGQSGNSDALDGQILAYSFTSFGQQGTAVNFQPGYGSAAVPGIATSGKNETSLISKVSLAAASQSGYSTLTISYSDEWALDGYNAYVKVNNGSPVFFSQGIWSPTPQPGDPLPPPNNNPGDAHPAYPSTSNSGSYTIVNATNNDWLLAIPNSNNSTFELSGSWTWGHQSDISGAASGTYAASVKYTFPTPNGTYLSITVFLEDGDHCGDYALATYTFKNVGAPGGGTQLVGTVELVQ